MYIEDRHPVGRQSAPRVLVVGAGPVGLTAAAFLARQGVPFDIIEKREGPVEDSRALGVHARTLEFMSMLGIDRHFVDEGLPTRYMSFHRRDRKLFSLDFESLKSQTDYPFYLILPQSRTEAILGDHLRSEGISILWGTNLLALEQHNDGVLASYENKGLARRKDYAFVIGTDGATSTVRRLIDVAFDGATYPADFLLSEVEIPSGAVARDATHVYFGERSTVAVIPQPNGNYRIVGPNFAPATPQATDTGAVPISFADFRAFLTTNGLFSGMDMHNPSRLLSYKMHKRVAARFRVDRVFLAGDAAHIHSPAGGQGMNTGMHDAVNLAWKIALVLNHDAPSNLLDTYETERRTFASAIVTATDRAMAKVMSRSVGSRILFDILAPLALRLHQPIDLIASMAQIAGGYAGFAPEAHTKSHPDGPKPGERFANFALENGSFTNRELGRGVTLFLSGTPEKTRDLERKLEKEIPGHSVHRLEELWRRRRRAKGFSGGVLCRPDGYVVAALTADTPSFEIPFLSLRLKPVPHDGHN